MIAYITVTRYQGLRPAVNDWPRLGVLLSAGFYGRIDGEADGIGDVFILPPGPGDGQFCVLSAVSEPGCVAPDVPEGEFDAEPLLLIGWFPLLVRLMLVSPHGTGLADGEAYGI
jgi:hypothetical protein